MAKVWITYAWKDNENQDVDFVIQELRSYGLEVKTDRWNIQAGKRLWEQIAEFIQNPSECDAWLMYVTENSLGSEPCKEEFAYALDRALSNRGNEFPVIGVFPASIDQNLIPPGIKTRLYVSLTDPDWKERIKASAEKRTPNINSPNLDPFYIQTHQVKRGEKDGFAIEVRPRAGAWCPFIAGIPNGEKEKVNMSIMHGPRNTPNQGGVLFSTGEGTTDDGNWWCCFAQNEATNSKVTIFIVIVFQVNCFLELIMDNLNI